MFTNIGSSSQPSSSTKRKQGRRKQGTFNLMMDKKKAASKKRNMPCKNHGRIHYTCRDCKEELRQKLMKEYSGMDEQARNKAIWLQMRSFFCLQCMLRAIETNTPLDSRDDSVEGLYVPICQLGKCKIEEHNTDALQKHCNCPEGEKKIWRACYKCIGSDPRAGVAFCPECKQYKRRHAEGCSQKLKATPTYSDMISAVEDSSAEDDSGDIESDDGEKVSEWRRSWTGEVEKMTDSEHEEQVQEQELELELEQELEQELELETLLPQPQQEQETLLPQPQPKRRQQRHKRRAMYDPAAVARRRKEAMNRNAPKHTAELDSAPLARFTTAPIGQMHALRCRQFEERLKLTKQEPSHGMKQSIQAARMLGGLDGDNVVNPEDFEWYNGALHAFAVALATGNPEDAAEAVELSDGIFALGDRRKRPARF